MQLNPESAQIDLHQIGAGFLGHFYFTHTYDGTGDTSATTTVIQGNGTESDPGFTMSTTVPAQVQHKVVGTWIPDIPAGSPALTYEIAVAVPDHGANALSVTYHIDHGFNNGLLIAPTSTCMLSQASNGNRWVYLGAWTLGPGADVWLDNMVAGAVGTNDIAFSSMIFEPVSSQTGACGASGTFGS